MTAVDTKRFPFSGFPTGWYAVAFSKDVKPGKIQACTYFGREFILYRTESGQIRATDAYCPHLGAHLGDARVVGEHVRCHFHGFEYDGEGQCVKNAYGTKAPPKARLGTLPVRDRNELVLVWFDALGRAPEWEVPEEDFSDWTGLWGGKMELDSHPQETSENSVDFGHFNEVHGFGDPRMEEEAVAEGHLLTAAYSATKQLGRLPGMSKPLGVRAKFFVEVHGLGYSLVRGEVPALGLRFRHYVLSSPVAEGKIHLRLASQVQHYRGLKLPLTKAAHAVSIGGLWSEVARDAPIWERKRYVTRPILAKGDGPIGVYRRWAKQFYPPEAPAGKPRISLTTV